MSRSILLIVALLAAAGCGEDFLGPDALVIMDVVLVPTGPVTDSVVVHVRAANASPTRIRVSSCFGLDLEVTNAAGDVIWRRFDGNVLALCTDDYAEIDPFEEREWTAIWWLTYQNDDPVPPGSYELTAVLRELVTLDPRAARSAPVAVEVI